VLIRVTHTGNIAASLEGLGQSFAKGTSRAMDMTAANLQGRLRFDTQAANLGPGVSNAWRMATYPPNKVSISPGGIVWSKASRIIAALADGVIIRAKKKTWLCIPLPTSGLTERTRNAQGKFVKSRMSPQLFEQKTGIDLQFVSVHGGKYALLVAVGQLKGKAPGAYGKASGIRKGTSRIFGPQHGRGTVDGASITKRRFAAWARYGGTLVVAPPRRTRTGAASRTGVTTVPVFLLLHTVMPPKLFDLEARADEAQRSLGANVAAELAAAAVPVAGSVG
jgi:hypothetical protein